MAAVSVKRFILLISSRCFLGQKNCASGCINICHGSFLRWILYKYDRTYTSPQHFDKNLCRDIVDIFFFLNQFARPAISPLKSFTTIKRGSSWLVSQFFASTFDFLLPKCEDCFKRTDNSTKPPLAQIKLNTSSTKTSAAISSRP